jgi:hypothetical protein
MVVRAKVMLLDMQVVVAPVDIQVTAVMAAMQAKLILLLALVAVAVVVVLGNSAVVDKEVVVAV